MKINKKFYDYVETAPFAVQNLENGGVIELHSMNQNQLFFDEFARKGRFVVWSSKDGKNYRLILEEAYYEQMREIYTTRVNQAWTNFWDAFKDAKKKFMLTILLPTFIISLLFVAAYAVLPYIPAVNANETLANTLTLGTGALMIISFFVGSTIYNKKIDKKYNELNADAVEKIKKIVGHDRFDELMDMQRTYTDEFLSNLNKQQEVVAEENKPEEVSEETKSEELVEEVKEDENHE